MAELPPYAIEQTIALLKDPRFEELHRIANKRPLSWAEFCTMEMPETMTCEQAWRTLNAIRRHTAISLPFPDGERRLGWYYPTRSIIDGLEDIEKRCNEGSYLDAATRSRNMFFSSIEAHVSEAITSLREDGIDIGYENARELLLGERDPEKPAELLIFNGYQVMREIDSYVEQPCTPDLIMKLYESLTEGIDFVQTSSYAKNSDADQHRARSDASDETMAPSYNPRKWKALQLDWMTTLMLVSKLINETRYEDVEHPLILAMGIRYLLSSNAPFPAWNNMTFVLLMKLLFKKSGLPVLTFVPINTIVSEWERGALRTPNDLPLQKDAEVYIDGEFDYTLYVDTVTRLVRLKLDEMDEHLEHEVKKDDDFMQALRDDLDVNYRQRDILRAALADPESVFRISDHQKRFMIAYGTARSDLLKLADLGLLRCVRNSYAFEFYAIPDLRQSIKAASRYRS